MHPNTGVCLLLLVLLAPQLSSSAPGLLAMHPCNIPQLCDNECLGNNAAHNSPFPSTVLLVMVDTLNVIIAMMNCMHRLSEVSHVRLLGPEPFVQSGHCMEAMVMSASLQPLGLATPFD